MAKYSQSPSLTCPALSGRAIFPPSITTGTSFSVNPCPQRVQKYQINLTQRCIRRFRNSQLCSAIPYTNCRGLGTPGLWTRALIWSECSYRQYIYKTSQWAFVLLSTISVPYICRASGTWLQGTIYQCQPRDHVWISELMGPIYRSDLDNPFQGPVPSFPVLYFSWTPLNPILQFQEFLPAGKTITTLSTRCQKTEQWILRSIAQEYALVIPTQYKDPHG